MVAAVIQYYGEAVVIPGWSEKECISPLSGSTIFWNRWVAAMLKPPHWLRDTNPLYPRRAALPVLCGTFNLRFVFILGKWHQWVQPHHHCSHWGQLLASLATLSVQLYCSCLSLCHIGKHYAGSCCDFKCCTGQGPISTSCVGVLPRVFCSHFFRSSQYSAIPKGIIGWWVLRLCRRRTSYGSANELASSLLVPSTSAYFDMVLLRYANVSLWWDCAGLWNQLCFLHQVVCFLSVFCTCFYIYKISQSCGRTGNPPKCTTSNGGCDINVLDARLWMFLCSFGDE